MLNAHLSNPLILDDIVLCKRVDLNHRAVSIGDIIKKNGETFTILGAQAPTRQMPRGCVITKEAGPLNPLSLKLEWKSVSGHPIGSLLETAH